MYYLNRGGSSNFDSAPMPHPPIPFFRGGYASEEEQRKQGGAGGEAGSPAFGSGKRRAPGCWADAIPVPAPEGSTHTEYYSPDSIAGNDSFRVHKHRRLKDSADGLHYRAISDFRDQCPDSLVRANPEDFVEMYPGCDCSSDAQSSYPAIPAHGLGLVSASSSAIVGFHKIRSDNSSAYKRELVGGGASRCVSCGATGGMFNASTSCTFCSRTTCSECLHFCAGCGLGFCAASCSTPVYLPRGTVACCLDCARSAAALR